MAIIRREQTELQEVVTEQLDAGYLSGGAITDNLDGTIDVAAGIGVFRISASPTAKLVKLPWAAVSSLALTDNSSNYVYVDYNSGTPQVLAQVGGAGITDNEKDKFELAEIYNEATSLHITPHKQLANSAINMMQQRFYSTKPIERSSGLILGETGTRNVTMALGVLWTKLDKVLIIAIDTSGTDTFERYYTTDSGTTWTKETAQSQWDNLQYNDITSGLVALTTNRYSNQYFYIEPDNNLVCVYGQAQYTSLAGAQAEDAPSLIPPRLNDHAILIGRIVFQQNVSTASKVESTFTTEFTASGVVNHSDLANLNFSTAGHGIGFSGFQRGTTSSSSDPTINDDSSAGYREGDFLVNTTSDTTFVCVDATVGAAVWKDITSHTATGVTSFNARTGVVIPVSGDYSKADVGLGNVDNTTDLAKPISTATQTALNGKEPTIVTLPISKGGTNSGTALVNDKVMISSGGSIEESPTVTTAQLGLLTKTGSDLGATTAGDNYNLGTGGLKDNDVTTPVPLGSPTAASLTTTAQNLVGAINEVNSGIAGQGTTVPITITSDGQTALPDAVPTTPSSQATFHLYWKGSFQTYGPLPDGDYTRSGKDITWNNRNGVTLIAGSPDLIASYDYSSPGHDIIWKEAAGVVTKEIAAATLDLETGPLKFATGAAINEFSNVSTTASMSGTKAITEAAAKVFTQYSSLVSYVNPLVNAPVSSVTGDGTEVTLIGNVSIVDIGTGKAAPGTDYDYITGEYELPDAGAFLSGAAISLEGFNTESAVHTWVELAYYVGNQRRILDAFDPNGNYETTTGFNRMWRNISFSDAALSPSVEKIKITVAVYGDTKNIDVRTDTRMWFRFLGKSNP